MVQEERAIISTNLLETISSFRPLVSFHVAGGSLFSVPLGEVAKGLSEGLEQPKEPRRA